LRYEASARCSDLRKRLPETVVRSAKLRIFPGFHEGPGTVSGTRSAVKADDASEHHTSQKHLADAGHMRDQGNDGRGKH